MRTVKESFYRFFIKTMMKFDDGALKGASVIIDGSGERTFRNDLNAYLRRQMAPGVIKDVRFKNSRSDPLVQLSDMCVGAIARSFRAERKDRNRWRIMLQPKIDDIWEFK